MKTGLWKRLSIWILTRVCLYDIKNINGDSHRLSNIIDICMLIIYLALTIVIIMKNQFTAISYGIILVLTIRTMLKHSKRALPSKSQNNAKRSYCLQEIIMATILGVSGIIYSILFFFIKDYSHLIAQGLFAIYYLINAILEYLDILINMFDAKPHLLIKEELK